MVQINFARREVTCKIVFYGPGGGGKTTNLEIIHKRVPDTARGHLTSIATDQERTLFFDFMPLDLGMVAGMKTKLLLYTVPGQVYYAGTRKVVLQGADGVAFVADSDPTRLADNVESIQDLENSLREYGLDARTMPLVIQFNKRDLPGAVSVAELAAKVNRFGAPTFEAVAVRGEGVMPTLKAISKMVIEKLNDEFAAGKTAAPAAPAEIRPVQPSRPKTPTPPPRPAVVRPASPTPPAVVTVPKTPLAPTSNPRTPSRPAPARPTNRFAPPPPPRKSRAWIWILLLLVTAGAGWFFALGPGKAWARKLLQGGAERPTSGDDGSPP